MKNYEKYEEKIREYDGGTFCADFVRPYILKQDDCGGVDCDQCNMLQLIWLLEDYEEPKTDWSKVEVDTPILVKYSESAKWKKRHFAKYENGLVYAWNNGETSWTTVAMTDWNYAKLAEDEKEHKEPEVDWSKVEVDTPILVRVFEGEKWKKRYFAKVENGDVYAWTDENTSLTAHGMTKWRYAKLAEDAKEDKEAETDWSKIKVNTPILVKDHEDGEWLKRYFAKYEDGYVYAWGNGCTSWNADNMYAWNYTKLVENEETK